VPRASQLGGFDLLGLVPLMCVLAAVFLPLLLGRRSVPPPDPEGGDDGGGGGGGGGGSGPSRPAAPRAPRGGLPLPDATPARVRLRGHARLAELLPARERRPAREPERVPARPRAARARACARARLWSRARRREPAAIS